MAQTLKLETHPKSPKLQTHEPLSSPGVHKRRHQRRCDIIPRAMRCDAMQYPHSTIDSTLLQQKRRYHRQTDPKASSLQLLQTLRRRVKPSGNTTVQMGRRLQFREEPDRKNNFLEYVTNTPKE